MPKNPRVCMCSSQYVTVDVTAYKFMRKCQPVQKNRDVNRWHCSGNVFMFYLSCVVCEQVICGCKFLLLFALFSLHWQNKQKIICSGTPVSCGCTLYVYTCMFSDNVKKIPVSQRCHFTEVWLLQGLYLESTPFLPASDACAHSWLGKDNP